MKMLANYINRGIRHKINLLARLECQACKLTQIRCLLKEIDRIGCQEARKRLKSEKRELLRRKISKAKKTITCLKEEKKSYIQNTKQLRRHNRTTRAMVSYLLKKMREVCRQSSYKIKILNKYSL
uniref:Uncharacterized protein n=1 Tax=Octopus bimaculoides TaxID=37653 RepID=A0A0L8GCD6_OCTBM